MGSAGKSAAAILGMRDGGGDIPRPSPPFLEREELPEPDVNNNPYGSSSTNFIGLPPSQRTSKAMEVRERSLACLPACLLVLSCSCVRKRMQVPPT
jgi:hypothetical protein